MPPTLVLDSFALLAYFLRERSAVIVEQLLDDASRGQVALAVTTVNLGEVLYRIERERGFGIAVRALQNVRLGPVQIYAADEALAVRAARFKTDLRMGYLDCFVVALAEGLGATIVTGDPDFRLAEGQFEISWLER